MFWHLLLAHTVADFILQPNCIWKLRQHKPILGNILHGLIFCPTALFISIPANLNIFILHKVAEPIFILTILHIFIDYLKTKINLRYKKESAFIFLIDQLYHIICIYIVSKFYYYKPLLHTPIVFVIAIFFILFFCGKWLLVYLKG